MTEDRKFRRRVGRNKIHTGFAGPGVSLKGVEKSVRVRESKRMMSVPVGRLASGTEPK